VQDFAWWAGLSMADARRGVEIAAAQALGDFLELPVGYAACCAFSLAGGPSTPLSAG